jgi:cyclophilin family peptidyl-prolyl cis-trans isomerase
MANHGPNSGGSQFFVTPRPLQDLNRVHTAFGQIIRGMDVVNKIASVKAKGEKPVTPVVLQKVRIEIVQ